MKLSAVPAMRTTITGSRFGGAYWDQCDYTVDLSHDGTAITMRVGDGFTTHLDEAINADQARALAENLTRGPLALASIGGLPGVELAITWIVTDHTTYMVDLADRAAEIAEWLKYATGSMEWNMKVDGPEWSY